MSKAPKSQASKTIRIFIIAIKVIMTQAMEWLKANFPGFNDLSNSEQDAIADFLLLWSLFEFRVLNTHGNVKNICDAIKAWRKAGPLDAAVFDEELAYFRQRYYADDNFTYHFQHLHFRERDREALVQPAASSHPVCRETASELAAEKLY